MKSCQQDSGREGYRSVAGGFTLIELTVALFLAVFLMVGVAEIFKISSQTASRVEAISDTCQMARTALSMLSEDLSQAAPDGYFSILPLYTKVPYDGTKTKEYRFDTLTFTAVGRYRQMGELLSGTAAVSPGAQIFYGPGTRQVSSSIYDYRAGLPTDARGAEDARGQLLVRKAFLLSGQPVAGTTSNAPAISAVPAISNSTFAQMAREASFNLLTSHRIKPVVTMDNISKAQFQKIDVSGGAAGYAPNVDFLVADRVSEFFVEVWGFDGTKMAFLKPKATGSTLDKNFIWTLGAKNEAFANQPNMPTMVRVTMVLHAHGDQAPLMSQPYYSQNQKFQGEVFRRVIRLPGPVAR